MKDDFVMQPESFAKKLIEILKSKISRKLEFDVQTVIKTNDCRKYAIVVREPDCQVNKTIYIEDMLHKYVEKGVELEKIAEDIMSICEVKSDFDKLISTDLFEKMKDFEYLLNGNIMLKLVNRERSETFLKGKTYIPYLDMAIVFLMTITDSDGGLGTVAIPEVCSKKWDISLEEAYKQVLVATENNYPMHRVTMREFMYELLEDKIGDVEALGLDNLDTANDMYIQTNIQKINGSATLLYKNNLAKFCDETGVTEVYVIPSSQHELILIPRKEYGNEYQLQSMIREVNQTQVQEHEILSDNLYIYNRATDEITIWNE